MRKVVVVLASAVVIAGVVVLMARSSDYTQTSCTIDKAHNFALIGMKRTTDVGSREAREYDIQFGPDGLVVRFPSRYYAPEWRNTDIIIEYPQKDAASGILKLRTPGLFGLSKVTTIGLVQRSCWEAVKGYIQKDVASSGVAVHLYEGGTK